MISRKKSYVIYVITSITAFSIVYAGANKNIANHIVLATNSKVPLLQIVKSVVHLVTSTGTCTGVKVIAPSKSVFILTAAHCDAGPNVGIMSIDEDSIGRRVHKISIDMESDLLLYDSDGKDGVAVANTFSIPQRVFTLSHGAGLPLYITYGIAITYELDRSRGKQLVTTAPVLPGSSGGPVFDTEGHLVGIIDRYEDDNLFSYEVSLENIKNFLKNR